jgi:hypothetical protein
MVGTNISIHENLMPDKKTISLAFTLAENSITAIAFIEMLVKHKPEIEGWQFKAFKDPVAKPESLLLRVNGIQIGSDNLFFVPLQDANYPDEINIGLVSSILTPKNQEVLVYGISSYVDMLLGDYQMVTAVDSFKIMLKSAVKQELIPIHKLGSFLKWREKELIEKYEPMPYDISQQKWEEFKARNAEGKNEIDVILDTNLLRWEGLIAYHWEMRLVLPNGIAQGLGKPIAEFSQFESMALDYITAEKGCLYLGKIIGADYSELYFACKEFRDSSHAGYYVSQLFTDEIPIPYDIKRNRYRKELQQYLD